MLWSVKDKEGTWARCETLRVPFGASLKISIIKTKGRKETQGEPEGQVGGRASLRSDRGVVLALVFIRNYSMFSLYENASPSSTDR